MKPLHLALSIGTLGGLLLFTLFPISPTTPQTAAVGTTATPTVSFTQEEVQVREGSSAKITVKLSQPVTRTTKVTVKLTGDQGTTSRDVPALSSTRSVTFYKNSPITTKSITIRTTKTAAQGDKAFTATVTKVGNTTVQGDTTRVIIKDQGSTPPVATPPTGNNTNNTTPPTNCAQYAGVIPGETRKTQNHYRSFYWGGTRPSGQYGSFSARALSEIPRLRGDLGATFGLMRAERARIELRAGESYAYPMKTSEYNVPFYVVYKHSDNPATTNGGILLTISECPFDFTSPELVPAPNPANPNIKTCMFYDFGTTYLTAEWGNSLMRSVFPPGACVLDDNKTYYFNITTGFKGDGTGKGYGEPFAGVKYSSTDPNPNSGTLADESYPDVTLRWHNAGGGSTFDGPRIKGTETYYAETAEMFRRWDEARLRDLQANPPYPFLD